MELELKHLVSYLPYGLQLQYVVRGDLEATGLMTSISHYPWETHPNRVRITVGEEEHIWMFKPILRPLSDLIKEIDYNGERFIPIEKLGLFDMGYRVTFDYQFKTADSSYLDVVEMPFSVVQDLLAWHFDIYGLIENGLATRFYIP